MKRSELKAIIKECIREADEPKLSKADSRLVDDELEGEEKMSTKVAEMIMGWLKRFGYPTKSHAEEDCAKWMRDKLRLGGVADNRKHIQQAIKMTHGGK
jgi:hypothetical protein